MRWLVVLALVGCCPQPPAAKAGDKVRAGEAPRVQAQEIHLADLRQLTFGGENAEAYWSFDGKELIFQASPPGQECDQIYRMKASGSRPVRLSGGAGATTCSYFLPGNKQIIYASTHLGGARCPPEPDRSQGYVWALYPSYDIFRADRDGKNLVRLTNTPGYDAEATVCPRDGSIIFTSLRDGDLELYRMDADGKNVKRLTETPGYDGGAFFNDDCSKIVWRASRPSGTALDDYRRLLKKNLVRPTKLEIYVGNADGSEARQITYLDAASFAPYWFPSSPSNGRSGKPTRHRIVFSSNYRDPKGREFDIWAVDESGANLERITFAPGFDGFPMFSPDGKKLAFASNRATAAGAHDTNIFVARWIDAPAKHRIEMPADRVMRDVAWLADPARQGRGLGTDGLAQAGEWIEKRFRSLALEGGLDDGGMRQSFEVPTRVSVGEATRLSIDGKAIARERFQPLSASSQGSARGTLVFAGYGIVEPKNGIDDYAKVDARGNIVLVRRFVPDTIQNESEKRRLGDLRYKAWLARERGAKALMVVDVPARPASAGPDWKAPEESRFPALRVEGTGDAGIPVVVLRREVGEDLIARGARARVDLEVALDFDKTSAFNVVGLLRGDGSMPGALVIGAHYDHLGMGGPGSLAPDAHAPHLGADDNASGVAVLLETARLLRTAKRRTRDVYFVAFTAEESGVLGSTHFVRHLPRGLAPEKIQAMLNMDMVGRLRNNRLQVLGGDSAKEWQALLAPACAAARIECNIGGDGYGPSDQTPFFAAGIPVLHYFTGAHSDYHKPSDESRKINAAGAGQIAIVIANTASALFARRDPLTLRRDSSAPVVGDMRSSGASLGTIPDYAGPPGGQRGVLLAGVRKGGAAETGGLQRGDILVKLGKHDIGDVRDLMFALGNLKPGESIKAVVLRNKKRLELPVTLQEQRGH